MDKEIRNRIQRATQAVRSLLEREYAEQLEGVFDIRLNGTIVELPGEHLDGAQRVLKAKLVAAIEHEMSGGMGPAKAVGSYLREAAFTSLNRFVALKMLEARGLVQECISKWDQSSGFKEFAGLAPGMLQLSDRGYCLYIESIFDEIGREIRVLFDRRDSASLLWPRRQTLQEVLAILNAADLKSVWDQDETIGWVYQYFNSDEERRHMRAQSQAPRDSRELAVRNQFFTPRYVVQFLTDNTFGRIWYEMYQGATRLADLEYLVRKPNEIFLAEGEVPPGRLALMKSICRIVSCYSSLHTCHSEPRKTHATCEFWILPVVRVTSCSTHSICCSPSMRRRGTTRHRPHQMQRAKPFGRTTRTSTRCA